MSLPRDHIAFSNTRLGMHNAYSLGCSCDDCNKAFEDMLKAIDTYDKAFVDIFQIGISAEMTSVKDGEIVKERIASEKLYNMIGIIAAQSKIAAEEGNKAFLKKLEVDNVYAKTIWNEAIEAAASLVDKDTRHDQSGYAFGPAIEIRKLKK